MKAFLLTVLITICFVSPPVHAAPELDFDGDAIADILYTSNDSSNLNWKTVPSDGRSIGSWWAVDVVRSRLQPARRVRKTQKDLGPGDG